MAVFIMSASACRDEHGQNHVSHFAHIFPSNDKNQATEYSNIWLRDQRPESQGWSGYNVSVRELFYEQLHELLMNANSMPLGDVFKP